MASHNNTNHDVVLMKLMIIQIFQFDCDSINIVSKRHSNVSLHIMFDEISGIDHILTDLHIGFPHSTSNTSKNPLIQHSLSVRLLPPL